MGHPGQHVNYLEIYEPDVLAAEMQPVLKYAASLFAPKQHSQRFAQLTWLPKGEHGMCISWLWSKVAVLSHDNIRGAASFE